VALVEETALAENRAQVGREVEVLVAEGEGRKDGATHRMSGRARDNRLVHFAPPGPFASDGLPRPGDVVLTRATSAAPHYLIADDPLLALRRTRAGDAWLARTSGAGTAPDGPGTDEPVLLGMPALGRPG